MRIKKPLKIIAITAAILVALLLLFVTAFIYNPTEGSLADMRDVVPRNVDFFVRKVDLKNDFSEFPEPKFWDDLSASSTWRQLAEGPMVQGIDRDAGVSKALDELRDLVDEVRSSSKGTIDILEDVLGEEVVIAGRLLPPSFDKTKFCAYARVSWKIRFAWGLLGWSAIRDQVANSGLALTAGGDGTFTLAAGGGQEYFLGRHLDCLMIANERGLLDRSLELAQGSAGEQSAFGQSSSYRDGIESRLRSYEDEILGGDRANALELYLRPDQLFSLTRWDDGWPNAKHKDDMGERVLASFLNLEAWRFMTVSTVFEPGILSILGRIDLNRNKHTGFQSEFFQAEPAPFADWLVPFLSIVPEGNPPRTPGACAAAALRVDPADFMLEMYEAMDNPSDLDEPLRKTGKYPGGVRELVDKLRPLLKRRVGFVFERARDLGIPVFDPSPAPHVAWVFWILPSAQPVLLELQGFLSDNRDQIGFTKVTDLTIEGLPVPCREFRSPHIPGTGEVTLLFYNNFFILSNSSYLSQDMIDARFNDRSLLQSDNWERMRTELPSHINGFVYVDGEKMSDVFDDYVKFTAEQSSEPDQSWMARNRARIERKVFDDRWQRFGSIARIPSADQERFDDEVFAEMQKEWSRQRSAFTAGDRNKFEQLRVLAKMLKWGYLQTELDPQFIQLTSSFVRSDR